MSGKPRHGMSNTRIHRCWSDMKQRCLNKNNKWYPSYGGRGINVCDEWMHFENFYDWAINNGYLEDLTLDRIDNNKGYCPQNCRWATHTQQIRNRRQTVVSKTGYVGVYDTPGRKKRYQARITIGWKRYDLGRFYTAEEASNAREEFARMNNV